MRTSTLLLLMAGCYDPRMYERPTAPPEPPCSIEVLHIPPSRPFREVEQLTAENPDRFAGEETRRRQACKHGGGDAIVVGRPYPTRWAWVQEATLIAYLPK